MAAYYIEMWIRWCDMQFIISNKETIPPVIAPDRIEKLGDEYEIWTYNDGELPPLSVGVYSYAAIPKCLAPLSTAALDKSGVFNLQRQFVPGLYGSGVFVVLIDTGINYAQDIFKTPDGRTKIAVLWDQSDDRIYSRDEINAALGTENPYDSVPGDDDGHGTAVAAIMCGNESPVNDFTGVAPEAQLIVIKLRKAEQTLRDFYFIPEDVLVYSEADIMRAVAFADRYADMEKRPAVMCIALGCNNGNHTGAEDLSIYLDSISTSRARAVIAGTGNEANNRHHYMGKAVDFPESIEINVEYDMDGFYMECWALAPDIFTISVISPSGQSNPAGIPVSTDSGQYTFVLEGTSVSIDYRQTGRDTRDLLVFIRFENVVRGVWNIRFFPQRTIRGIFHVWLPMAGLLEHDVTFIVPDPDTTLTMPSDARRIITTGGYNSLNDAIFLESGRGFNASGTIKPDFTAPAVDISTTDLRGNFIQFTGTSAAAAITTGVSALVMEWMIVRGNLPLANGVDIRNSIIRNCRRKDEIDYPNKISGYGYLNGFAYL